MILRVPPATLTIARQSPQDVGIRQVIVSLDGEEFGVLLNGQSVTKEVPAGDHKLRFNNTLVWKTVRFEIRPGEHVRFNVTNRAGFGTYALVATLGVGPIYLRVERLQERIVVPRFRGACGSAVLCQVPAFHGSRCHGSPGWNQAP